jgi:hypothetical protein
MPVHYVTGDPLLTQAQVLAFGHNRAGRSELGDLETLLLNRYPAAFSMYRKTCRKDRIQTGTTWLWRDTSPFLGFMVIRETPFGATRLRYVQSVMMSLARDFRLDGLQSLAITPLGDALEWPEIKLIIDSWLGNSPLPVIVYETYQPGVKAAEMLGAQ